MTTLVVGGGIAGVACAEALAQAGVSAELRERGHRLGGRMASRTLRDTGTAFDGRVVDIGASYFTVSDEAFAERINALVDQGVVRAWADGFHVAGPTGIEAVSGGSVRYAAPGGLRSVVEALAALSGAVPKSTESNVTAVDVVDGRLAVDGSAFDAVALCMPTPQARRLSVVVPDLPIPWEPVIAVTMVFDRQHWIDIDGVFVNDDSVITWIADDGSRRGDDAPVLVAHVHPVLSAGHLDDPSAVIPMAIAAVQRVLHVSAYPDWVDAHRWSFAKPLAASGDAHWLHEDAILGVAGDAWAGGPRVEAAWLSGRSLGLELAALQTR